MTVSDHPNFDAHETVAFWNDDAAGLKAIAAIHRRGQRHAIGGCRMHAYAASVDALSDVLRLSRAMSYKSAIAGLPFGGGKCVIIGDPRRQKTPQLLRSMGRFIESFGGRFVTGEDVGIGVSDVEFMRSETTYLVGREGADSSPAAAYGVFVGIKAAVDKRLGSNALDGLRVAVLGIGQVGFDLAEYLFKAGVELTVSDIDEARTARAAERFGAHIVSPNDAHAADVDVFAPCALGGAINPNTISEMRCAIVAGGANNQLSRPDDASALRDRNILYAPDYVINAGGVINNALLLEPDYSREAVLRRCEGIGPTLHEVFDRAIRDNTSTSAAADQIAKDRLSTTGL